MWGTQEKTQYTNGHPYTCLRSKCHVVGQPEKSSPNTSGFDAATYNLRTAEGWGSDMPMARKHVMYITESPDNTPEAMRRTAANVKFDYTMTYRWDSDIPVQAAHVVHKATPNMEALTHDWSQGRLLVAYWFVSNCQTSSGRETIAKEIDGLDMFGACSGRKGCSYVQKKKKPEKYAQCMRDIAAKYRFYLSFENSRCDKYITEKFWRPLWKGNVPVVLGGLKRADYEEIAPPGSFIHVDDFKTTKHLSEYLQYLTTNDTAYNEYHHSTFLTLVVFTMALGPFARILAQVALVAGSAIGRAFVQAFQEAAQKGATQAATRTLRRQMPLEEAYKILGFDATAQNAVTRQEIAEHYKKLYDMNGPTGAAAGSPYLQQRIENAQKVIIQHIESQKGSKS
ncbi:conserved hypothetical protein [Perkinsus marinus ATCC 50983]|uniref:Fucosyltransferase n=1 Tax=Perkinsus marinus (strain ATCC 50983 / TXsc) TaxID=423536 RepID=C5L6L4_PERM5|nr:conserved hypothetical protein [Perkinsus marinus ATCC 50983]EER07675.1 conserved hypothetical protein [Perkinsus marinus ATCC 50983]|eukprot:XP_002775859.1 conserved hypothetical protein [Perkinsus marinus ATCC 50983]